MVGRQGGVAQINVRYFTLTSFAPAAVALLMLLAVMPYASAQEAVEAPEEVSAAEQEYLPDQTGAQDEGNLPGEVSPQDAPRLQEQAPRQDSAGAGKVLLADNFDDPARGVLPKTSPEPSRYGLGYVGGEYQTKGVEAEAGRLVSVALPGQYTDTAVSMDVRLVGQASRVRVFIACRSQGSNTPTAYRLFLGPDTGLVQLIRRDPGVDRYLGDRSSSAALRGAVTNHLELRCSGTHIAGLVNGVEVFAAEDRTYQKGEILIGMRLENPGDARWDNLVVRELTPTALSGS